MFDDRTGARPLTVSERRRLNELDRWFQIHDPGLAASLAHGSVRRGTGGRFLALMMAAILGPLMLLSMLVLCGAVAVLAVTGAGLAATIAVWSRVRRSGPRSDRW